MNTLKNWILLSLIKRTNLHAPICRAVFEKCSIGELENYIKERKER